MRKKIKNGKPVLFNLTDEEKELVDYYSGQLNFSKSDFVGWLVRAYHTSANPVAELENIKEQKDKLEREIATLNGKEKEAINRLKYFEESKKEQEKTKQKAINILKTQIMHGKSREEIEAIAKGWAIRLNTDAAELLFKASRIKNAP